MFVIFFFLFLIIFFQALENTLAIVMEFCSKGSLAKLLQSKPISTALKVKIALDSAKGVKVDFLFLFFLIIISSFCTKIRLSIEI